MNLYCTKYSKFTNKYDIKIELIFIIIAQAMVLEPLI